MGTLVSSCYVILTFCNDLKSDIHALDESSKAKENPAILMGRVTNIVKFHSTAKQLSRIYNQIICNFLISFLSCSLRLVPAMDNFFAIFIIVFFLWALSTVCSTLLVVQVELVESSFWSLLWWTCHFDQISFIFHFRNEMSIQFL